MLGTIRITGKRIPFFVFDVSLFTRLPATRRRVELDGEEVSSDVGIIVYRHMAEWEEEEEMVRRVPNISGKKRQFSCNCVCNGCAM